ncbi:MAG: preprotein translocase subunit SecG [Pseudomonadota bacterium]
MQTVLLIIHLLLALVLIALALLQHGKGADAGAAFGAGASNTMFGARGSANFLSRSTAAVAALFFLSSLGLGYLFARPDKAESVMDRAPAATTVAPEVTDLPPATSDSMPNADGSKIPADLPPSEGGK